MRFIKNAFKTKKKTEKNNNPESFIKSHYCLHLFLFIKMSKFFSFTNSILIGLENDCFSKNS